MAIWQGKGGDTGIKEANNIGLLLEISPPTICITRKFLGKDDWCTFGKVLLPGDCDYKAMPQTLIDRLNKFDYKLLAVPHHASDTCNRTGVIDELINPPSKKTKGYAIVSCGSSRYPGTNHKKDLECSYQVECTRDIRFYQAKFK